MIWANIRYQGLTCPQAQGYKDGIQRGPLVPLEVPMGVGIDRRQFLVAATGSLGLGVLSACGSSSSPVAIPSASRHPPLSAEPGALSILEWPGYEAAGTKAQT